MHGLAVSSSHLLLLRYSWLQQPLRKILSSSWKTEMSTFLHVCVWSSRATSPISHHPSFLRADMRGQLSDSPPHSPPSLSANALTCSWSSSGPHLHSWHTHFHSCMHSQVAPCSDSSPQLIWSIKQGRLAGLHCDTSFALRGEVTVIGVPFKGSASPGRMLSKLTAFAGFHFAKLTGRRSAFSYGTTSSALKTIIIFFLCLQHHLDLVWVSS